MLEQYDQLREVEVRKIKSTAEGGTFWIRREAFTSKAKEEEEGTGQ